MRLRPTTWNGNDIQAASGYDAGIPVTMTYIPEVDVLESERWNNYPTYAGQVLHSNKLIITFTLTNATDDSKYNQIAQWFYPDDALHDLVCQDTAVGGIAWKVQAKSRGVIARVENFVHVSMYVPDPRWVQNVAQTASKNITASGQQQTITPAGNLNTAPVFTLTIGGAKGADYSFHAFRPFYNTMTTSVANGLWYLLTTMDTATEVTAGRMRLDGFDLRVKIKGKEVIRWLTGMNTASTKIWVSLPAFGAKAEVTLSGSIAGSGAVTTIQFKKTAANIAALKRMTAPGLLYSVGGEAYSFTAVDTKNVKVNGVTRAVRDTAMSAQVDGDIFRYLQLDITVVWGKAAETDPAYADDTKPLLDLTNSTNTSWVDPDFFASSGLRGGWKPSIISRQGPNSNYYTGPTGGSADPASEMGLTIQAYQLASLWKASTAEIEWRLFCPIGITSVTTTGQKRRESSDWPAKVELQKSTDGVTWVQVWNEATPAGAASWGSITNTGASALSATYQYIRYHMYGSIKATANDAAYLEIQAVTMALASGNVPGGTLQARVSNYTLAATMTNTYTGDAMSINLESFVGDVITIDCGAQTATRADGTSVVNALSWNSSRDTWLDIAAGPTLTPVGNIFQYDDPGTNNVTWGFSWRALMAA